VKFHSPAFILLETVLWKMRAGEYFKEQGINDTWIIAKNGQKSITEVFLVHRLLLALNVLQYNQRKVDREAI